MARCPLSSLAQAARRHASSSASTTARAVAFAEHGDPGTVLRGVTYPLKPPAANEARVRFRLSAINPADVNVIEGAYPVKPPKREDLDGLTIVGNEGVAIVEGLGAEVDDLKEGDWVVCGKSQLGTWTSTSNIAAKELIRLPRSTSGSQALTEAQGAMLAVNPATAYRLLRDFVQLEKGGWVVQNGANSAAGTAVIQLCKAWGYQSINIVRDRDDIDALRSRLQQLGATHVLTTSELEDKGVRKTVKALTSGAPVRLGLNCVSGPSTTHLASRILTDNATLVTYGAMSKQPLSLPSSLHIFKGLVSRGFWLSAWYESQASDARAKMAAELVQLFESGQLVEPEHEVVELSGDDDQIGQQAREAVKRSMGGRSKKLLFRFAE